MWSSGTRSTASSPTWPSSTARRGDKIYVEGSIEYRSWQDREGQTRYTTEIKANEIILLGGKGGSSEGAPSRASASAPAKAGSAAPGGKEESFSDFPEALDGEDDDLPF